MTQLGSAAALYLGVQPVSAVYVGSARAWPLGIVNGSQITAANTGPWAIQGVAKGSEAMQTPAGPGRGFWRFDTPSDFIPAVTWPANANDANPSVLNSPSLLGGTLDRDQMIDGYLVPAGTVVLQWAVMPDNYDFYAQGTSLKVLFRGCRFRWSIGVSGTGIFNDAGSTSAQQIMVHYCDIGLQTMDPVAGCQGLMHIKWLGGLNHRAYRCYNTRSAIFYQPNTQGVEITECFMGEYLYAFGEAGTTGAGPDSTTYHLNGISCEGGLTSIKILRNSILAASPDGSTGLSGHNAGQIGYGTQPGQLGYGAGSAPGRLITQTDCIALFSSNTLPNIGDSVTGIQVSGNLLGGSGYCLYAANQLGNCQNVKVTNNLITTKWWTNGGNHGPITDVPNWGVNGNVTSGNTWYDDYGTGGDGTTLTSGRQYPAGNGPRKGTTVF